MRTQTTWAASRFGCTRMCARTRSRSSVSPTRPSARPFVRSWPSRTSGHVPAWILKQGGRHRDGRFGGCTGFDQSSGGRSADGRNRVAQRGGQRQDGRFRRVDSPQGIGGGLPNGRFCVAQQPGEGRHGRFRIGTALPKALAAHSRVPQQGSASSLVRSGTSTLAATLTPPPAAMKPCGWASGVGIGSSPKLCRQVQSSKVVKPGCRSAISFLPLQST